jgi:hypothetical protein
MELPMRHSLKQYFPLFYKGIQKWNERDIADVFENIIQKSAEYCAQFRNAVSRITNFSCDAKHKDIPFIYSSWGSDIFSYSQLGIAKSQVSNFLGRVNYLITDCHRDYKIALENGYKNTFF